MKQRDELIIIYENEAIKIKSRNELIFNDLAYVCLDQETNEIIAYGREAKKIIDKVNYPLITKKVINDFGILERDLLKDFFSYLLEKNPKVLKKKDILVSSRTLIRNGDQDFILELLKTSEPESITVKPTLFLSALGSSVNVNEEYGTILIHLGYELSTIGIILKNEVIDVKQIPFAEEYLRETVQEFLLENYNLYINGDEEFERIFYSCSSLTRTKELLEIVISGFDKESGLPRKIVINDLEIQKVFLNLFSKFRAIITELLDQASPNIRAGIIKNGFCFTGSLAKIYGLVEYFESFFDIATRISPNPDDSILIGATIYWQNNE